MSHMATFPVPSTRPAEEAPRTDRGRRLLRLLGGPAGRSAGQGTPAGSPAAAASCPAAQPEAASDAARPPPRSLKRRLGLALPRNGHGRRRLADFGLSEDGRRVRSVVVESREDGPDSPLMVSTFAIGGEAAAPGNTTPPPGRGPRPGARACTVRPGVSADSDGRRLTQMLTFGIEGAEGRPAGRVADVLVGPDERSVAYVAVDVGGRMQSRLILLPPAYIRTVDWADGRMSVALEVDRLAGAPEYEPAAPLEPDFETALADYYGY